MNYIKNLTTINENKKSIAFDTENTIDTAELALAQVETGEKVFLIYALPEETAKTYYRRNNFYLMTTIP